MGCKKLAFTLEYFYFEWVTVKGLRLFCGPPTYVHAYLFLEFDFMCY